MPEVTLTDKDVTDAVAFLAQFQTERIPEASFAVGSANRDILVNGFAYMYAFLRGEIDRASARQSLLRIQEELTDADDIAQAVDEILSNWFVSRKGGQFARMVARMHFTEKRAQAIPLGSKFWRTNTTVFYVDSDVDPYVVSEDRMFPVFDSRGVLTDYVVDVPMIAARVGEAYIIEPGPFVRTEIPGGLAYFSYAENTEASSGGTDVESSDELIERADTVISVRNLVNNRSCDVTLQDQYPDIEDTLTVGMGEVELIRDIRTEIAPHILLHLGGHYDTYVQLRLTTVEENLTVGGFFQRPDGIVSVFRDPQLTYDIATFTSLGIQPGHVLFVRSGLIGSPRGYPIIRVDDHEIAISEAAFFPEASDERDPTENNVLYSIGWFAPGFDQIEFEPGIFERTAAQSATVGKENVPWGTSRRLQQPGKVVLSGRPIQDIRWVELTDPPAGDPLIDPSTGTLVFYDRVNHPPAQQAEPAYTQYQLTVNNPEKSQSMKAVNVLTVGYGVKLPNPPGGEDWDVFDGKNLRVVYDTLEGFSSIHAYIVDRNQRVAAANHLARARHPVWIEVNVPYRLKPATTEELDIEQAAQDVAEFVNTFDPNDDLDVSDISAFVRQTYSQIGAVYPLEIFYSFDSPDGQQALFSTTDIVSIFMTDSKGVVLENGADITPDITTPEELRDWFQRLGVSDRTVQYRTSKDRVSFTLRD
jgi:hypothetical protein